MNSCSEPLSTDVHMDDNALRLPRESGVAIGHREGDHFVRTSYDAGEGVFLFYLPFRYGLYDAGMVRAKIDEDVFDTKLNQALKEGITSRMPMRSQLCCNLECFGLAPLALQMSWEGDIHLDVLSDSLSGCFDADVRLCGSLRSLGKDVEEEGNSALKAVSMLPH